MTENLMSYPWTGTIYEQHLSDERISNRNGPQKKWLANTINAHSVIMVMPNERGLIELNRGVSVDEACVMLI